VRQVGQLPRIIIPTCFRVNTPSSGSLQFVSAKVMKHVGVI